MPNGDIPQRQSLDSKRLPRMPRSAVNQSFERQPPTAEEGFEEVGLEDHKQSQPHPPPQKRSFFSKFSDSREKDGTSQPTVSRFLIGNRKRAQSGQGAELSPIDQSQPEVTVATEGQEMH